MNQLHASQSAPIHEYQILWTSQKTQKLKKWHDGVMRVHTHNNRLCVYDQSGTFITELFQRHHGGVNEGDELIFDQHLVTVEQFRRTVNQDLTLLYEPKRQRIAAAAATAAATTPARKSQTQSTTLTPIRKHVAPGWPPQRAQAQQRLPLNVSAVPATPVTPAVQHRTPRQTSSKKQTTPGGQFATRLILPQSVYTPAPARTPTVPSAAPQPAQRSGLPPPPAPPPPLPPLPAEREEIVAPEGFISARDAPEPVPAPTPKRPNKSTRGRLRARKRDAASSCTRLPSVLSPPKQSQSEPLSGSESHSEDENIIRPKILPIAVNPARKRTNLLCPSRLETPKHQKNTTTPASGPRSNDHSHARQPGQVLSEQPVEVNLRESSQDLSVPTPSAPSAPASVNASLERRQPSVSLLPTDDPNGRGVPNGSALGESPRVRTLQIIDKEPAKEDQLEEALKIAIGDEDDVSEDERNGTQEALSKPPSPAHPLAPNTSEPFASRTSSPGEPTEPREIFKEALEESSTIQPKKARKTLPLKDTPKEVSKQAVKESPLPKAQKQAKKKPLKRPAVAVPSDDEEADPFITIQTPPRKRPKTFTPVPYPVQDHTEMENHRESGIGNQKIPVAPRTGYDQTGPWSIEAFDLFDWRPLGMEKGP